MDRNQMSKEEAVVEKIRKLLALADESRNNSEEEAIRAAMKAQSLMAKYDIDIKQVRDADKECQEMLRRDIGFKKNSGYNIKWRFRLAKIIANNFRVKTFMTNGDGIAFYGHKTDVEIAESVFNFIFATGNRLSVKYYYQCQKEGKQTKGVINEWLIGFCQGLKDELEKQCVALALVIAPDVEESYAVMSKDFVTSNRTIGSRSFSDEAFNAGRTEGRYAVKSRQLEG